MGPIYPEEQADTWQDRLGLQRLCQHVFQFGQRCDQSGVGQ